MKIKLLISICLVMFSISLTNINGEENKEYIIVDSGHGEPGPSVT